MQGSIYKEQQDLGKELLRPITGLDKCDPNSHNSKRLMVGLDSRPSGPGSSNTPFIPESDAPCIHTKLADSHACFFEKNVNPRGWAPPGC